MTWHVNRRLVHKILWSFTWKHFGPVNELRSSLLFIIDKSGKRLTLQKNWKWCHERIVESSSGETERKEPRKRPARSLRGNVELHCQHQQQSSQVPTHRRRETPDRNEVSTIHVVHGTREVSSVHNQTQRIRIRLDNRRLDVSSQENPRPQGRSTGWANNHLGVESVSRI